MEGREEERKEKEGKREGGRKREECCAVVIFPRKKPDVQYDTEATVCVQQSPNTTQLGR